MRAFINVMGIGSPGTLLGIVVEEKVGQLKKIVDAITEENISFGSILVARYWEEGKRAVFPYLLTGECQPGEKKVDSDLGYTLLDPMKWYLDRMTRRWLKPECIAFRTDDRGRHGPGRGPVHLLSERPAKHRGRRFSVKIFWETGRKRAFLFYFFSKAERQAGMRTFSTGQPHLTLVDKYHMSYEQWQGDRVARLPHGPVFHMPALGKDRCSRRQHGDRPGSGSRFRQRRPPPQPGIVSTHWNFFSERRRLPRRWIWARARAYWHWPPPKWDACEQSGGGHQFSGCKNGSGQCPDERPGKADRRYSGPRRGQWTHVPGRSSDGQHSS